MLAVQAAASAARNMIAAALLAASAAEPGGGSVDGALSDRLRERHVADVDGWLRELCRQTWVCDVWCYKDAEKLCWRTLRGYENAPPAFDGGL